MASTCKASNNMPKPTNMSTKQMAEYLNDLRTNRVPRTNGSRPLPQSSVRRPVARDVSISTLTFVTSSSSDAVQSKRTSSRSSSGLSHRTTNGLDMIGQWTDTDPHFPSYIEEIERQKERLEAREVRLALEEVHSWEDQHVHSVTPEEITDLVGNNQGVEAPLHLRHQEAAPMQHGEPGRVECPVRVAKMPQGDESLTLGKQRSLSSRMHSSISSLTSRRRSSGSRRVSSGTRHRTLFANPKDRIYEDPTEPVRLQASAVGEKRSELQPAHVRRNPFARARCTRQSLPSATSFATKGMLFERVEVQKTRLTRPPTPVCIPDGNNSQSSEYEPTKLEDINHHLEDAQFKDSLGWQSDEIRAATSGRLDDRGPKLHAHTMVTNGPEWPIVSFMSDLSRMDEKSDSNDQGKTQRPSPLSHSFRDGNMTISASAPVIPTLKYPDIPSIRVEIEASRTNDVPQTHTVHKTPPITIEESPSPASDVASIHGFPIPPTIVLDAPITKPLDRSTQGQPFAETQRLRSKWSSPSSVRPPARHSASVPVPTGPHWSPSIRRNIALCAHCALPISGKVVTAAGTRFHPGCFSCFHCGEGLECVAFYPEPADRRAARISRIQRRLKGQDVDDEIDHATEADDGDESLRFYCHLDFHEFFSPRCKSCKTPIEGEIIVACGADWHAGHFFCAQCGDPFDPSTPFVEKDGYAWCINCHTNRFSAKCRKCKRPVTDTVVTALGAEWHDECFCCTECHGKFEDERYFLRGGSQDPVCSSCEEKRLKA